MGKVIVLIAAILAMSSCRREYRLCNFQTADKYLKAYNDILNEIIVHSTYRYYLGKDEEQIFERTAKTPSDSASIEADVIHLHNNLFADTARQCTILLDTILKSKFRPWTHFLNDTTSFGNKIKDAVNTFSHNGQTVIDSLNSIQTQYKYDDFRVCVAKIRSIKSYKTETPNCYIGKIALSKFVFNQAADKAILYYEFVCGELCGYGRIIVCDKRGDYWQITGSIPCWFS